MVSHEQWHQHSMLYTETHTPKKEEDVNPPNNPRRPPLRSTQANIISLTTDTPSPRTTTALPSTKPPSTVSSPPVSAV